MALRIAHKAVEPRDEPSPEGFVRIEQGRGSAVLLTPDDIDPDERLPLVTVFHGAGRQDEMLVRACRDEPARRRALFLVPRSVDPTWDLITGRGQDDLEFLEYAWDLVYRRYPVDPERQVLMGYSDGASYALSMALSNPGFFDAVLCWAAGFVVMDRSAIGSTARKPRIYLEHGTHDELFPFDRIAIPMRDDLRKAGYELEFSVDEGGRHWPSGTFQREALDWYFGRARLGEPGRARLGEPGRG
jgi:phospholipase/carboxylesterase